MGAAAAADLAEGDDPPVRLLLVDRDQGRLDALAARLAGRTSVDVRCGDLREERTLRALDEAEVIGAAVSWADAEPVLGLAVRKGKSLAGIGRPPADPHRLVGAEAERSGCRLLLPVGLEPGLTEILARRLASGFGICRSLDVYCGGVPVVPRSPLRHVSLFGDRLSIALRDAYAVRGGRLRRVERFTGVRRVDVPGVGVLEAYHDGLLPWVREDPVLGRVARIEQRTLRWPGFAARVRLLAQLGLLADAEVTVEGARVSPRAVVDAVLTPQVRRRPGEEDVSILVVEGAGADRDGSPRRSTTTLVARAEPRDGTTGMARLTGTALAEAVRVLARKAGSLAPGVVPPAEAFSGEDGDSLLARLRSHGVLVAEGEDDRAPASRPRSARAR
jgi:saccharopine dehydrogenase-like NADP-dependent oxidoreductase